MFGSQSTCGPHARIHGRPGYLARFIVCLSMVASAGCGPGGYESTPSVSSLAIPEGWEPDPTGGPSVPGRTLSAWRGPEGASLVLYETLPIPRPNARSLVDEQANRLRNLPSTQVMRAETIERNGRTLACIEVVAPGDGRSLAPSGLGRPILPSSATAVNTRQVTVASPGRSSTLWLVWHHPESANLSLRPVIDKVISSWVPGHTE